MNLFKENLDSQSLQDIENLQKNWDYCKEILEMFKDTYACRTYENRLQFTISSVYSERSQVWLRAEKDNVVFELYLSEKIIQGNKLYFSLINTKENSVKFIKEKNNTFFKIRHDTDLYYLQIELNKDMKDLNKRFIAINKIIIEDAKFPFKFK